MPVDNLPLWIGLALVVCMGVGYAWRAKKNRTTDQNSKDFQERLGMGVGDPLADDSQGPSFVGPATDDALRGQPSTVRIGSRPEPASGKTEGSSGAAETQAQPVQEELDFNAMNPAVPRNVGRLSADVDSGIEAVVNFTPRSGTFDAEKIRAIESMLAESRFGDIVRVDYQNGKTGRWSHSSKGLSSCSQVYMALLLANRVRTLDALTASSFLTLADRIAIEIGADASLPDSQMMLDAAQQITDVIVHFDSALTIKIAAAEDFDQSAVRAAATACGFTYKGDHYDRCSGGTDLPVMQLWPSEQLPNEMEFSLDIPMTSAAANPLGDFFAAGNDLCCRLGAGMTDPVGQPIGPAVATMICRQLSEMYEQMAVSGVSAGSLRARRIFSRI